MLPKTGSIETIFERLQQYITPVDLEWEKKIKPAKKCDIEKVYKLSRMQEIDVSFPAAYVEYLNKMGECDGEILLSGLYNAKSDLNTILRYYEELEIDSDIEDPDIIELTSPSNYLFAYNDECDYGYYITTKDNGKQIITSGDEEKYNLEYFSEDFEKLLFQNAYLTYERRYFEYQYNFGTSHNTYLSLLKRYEEKDIFVLIDEIMKKHDFKRVWFSDSYHYIAEKGNISFGIWKDDAVYGFVTGESKEQVEKYGNIIKDILVAERLYM